MAQRTPIDVSKLNLTNLGELGFALPAKDSITTQKLSKTNLGAVMSGNDFTGYVPPSAVIKTLNGLAIASIKIINGLAVASVKKYNGVAYQ